MKNFTIKNNETNLNWVSNNLVPQDYKTQENEIVIFFYDYSQKNDILTELNKLEEVISRVSVDELTTVTVDELETLKNGNKINGLDDLKNEELLFGTKITAEIIYKICFFSDKKGLNVYCQKPQLSRHNNTGEKFASYNAKGFRLGTITFNS